MSETTNLVYKVNGIIREKEELYTLIHDFVMEKELESEFYNFLQEESKKDEYYTMVDLDHMALDYTGHEAI